MSRRRRYGQPLPEFLVADWRFPVDPISLNKTIGIRFVSNRKGAKLTGKHLDFLIEHLRVWERALAETEP